REQFFKHSGEFIEPLGIESASKEFFNKSPKNLQIEEAAVLIGMLKANHRYNPKFNPDKSLSRRNTVLEQMNKYNFLSDDSLALLKAKPIKINYRSAEMDGMAQYFKYYLGEYLKPWCKEKGIDLYRSGLKIYTTLNPKLQQYAEKAVQKHMPELQSQFTKRPPSCPRATTARMVPRISMPECDLNLTSSVASRALKTQGAMSLCAVLILFSR
ncbi:MAG: hypothetical protein EBU80_12060, partial [Chitinophagia bacterium]|nr:hypothetical protein [Chitinophagia bacterium]